MARQPAAHGQRLLVLRGHGRRRERPGSADHRDVDRPRHGHDLRVLRSASPRRRSPRIRRRRPTTPTTADAPPPPDDGATPPPPGPIVPLPIVIPPAPKFPAKLAVLRNGVDDGVLDMLIQVTSRVGDAGRGARARLQLVGQAHAVHRPDHRARRSRSARSCRSPSRRTRGSSRSSTTATTSSTRTRCGCARRTASRSSSARSRR